MHLNGLYARSLQLSVTKLSPRRVVVRQGEGRGGVFILLGHLDFGGILMFVCAVLQYCGYWGSLVHQDTWLGT